MPAPAPCSLVMLVRDAVCLAPVGTMYTIAKVEIMAMTQEAAALDRQERRGCWLFFVAVGQCGLSTLDGSSIWRLSSRSLASGSTGRGETGDQGD